jgi:hypothetical protein
MYKMQFLEDSQSIGEQICNLCIAFMNNYACMKHLTEYPVLITF